MPNNNESTMKWKVDITQLKAAMQEAKRSISQTNAEFKTATAGMDMWSKSTTGLEAKLKQLNNLLPAQKRQLEVLEAQYADTVKKMGENSSAAADLKIKIEEQKATITKTETSISRYNDQLADMKAKEAESESATGKLTKTIAEQEKQLEQLKKAHANAVLQYGENSTEAKSLASQIESLSGKLADNKKKLTDAEGAADQFDKSLEDAGKSAGDAANGGFTVLKGALANLVADGISKAIEGLKQLAGKVVEVGKQSIEEYANYEQLVGGVETLFGTGGKSLEEYADSIGKTVDEVKGEYENLMSAQDSVLANADKAYKTAGLSANDYMETVTSFSASLIQGLNGDTAKAAKIADMAIVDMSDNANKMGSDMASLQNAYQGFAKGNFTMLDNLKLGYGGTKEEMLRLVKDAGVVEESVESIDHVSFDQIIESIHIIQDEIGITGTTSKEAADTIEGSKNAMKASWSNLLKEFAKSDGDVGAAFEQFAEAAVTYGKNLLPRVGELVGNVIDFARSELEKRSPELLGFIDGIVNALKTVADMIKGFFDFISKYWSIIVPVLAGLATALGYIALQSIGITGLKTAFMGLSIVQKAVTAAQWLMNAAMNANPIGIVVAAIVGLVAAFVILWNKSEAFREFWIGLWEKIKEAASIAKDKISEWIEIIKQKIQEFSDKAGEIKDSIVEKWENIKSKTADLKDRVVEFFEGIKTGIQERITSAKEKVSEAVEKIKEFLSFSGLKKKVTDLFESIKEKITSPIEKAKELVTDAVDKIKGIFPISMGKIFSGIKLPHFNISGGEAPWGIMGQGTKPSIDIDWYARGGVIDKKSVVGVGESGAEAIVPLENNTKWISRVARELVTQINAISNVVRGNVAGVSPAGEVVKTQNVTFNQTINSPKAVDRLTVYRETNDLLFSAKVRLGNV